MRQLSLHASALNDAEYNLYTASLSDIADEPHNPDAVYDDAHYERMAVGVREARAWLRGRYSHIPAPTVDLILKFFSPSLGPSDSLSGGQFFAALRLVVHVDNGKHPDRSLAFIQAHPSSKMLKATSNVPPTPSWRHDAPTKSVLLSLPPTVTHISPTPSTSSSTVGNNPFTFIASSDAGSTHNQSCPLAPPLHPMLRVDPFKATSQSSHNPFAKAQDSSSTIKSPPLPPRKPPPPVPPSSTRHTGPPIAVKRSASPIRPDPGVPSLRAAGSTPPLPPPKAVSHHTSTLIKQSLHASKVAQSLKKAEEQLEKERIMQVLKSSSGTAIRNRSPSPPVGSGVLGNVISTALSSSSRSGSDERGRAAPPLPKRREQLGPIRRMDPSPPQSTSSYEQIALSGIVPRRDSITAAVSGLSSDAPLSHERGRSYSHPPRSSERARSETNRTIMTVDSHPESVAASATSSPARLSAGLPAFPPPTHPDRRERDERDNRRYSSVSLHSGKSGKLTGSAPVGSAGRLATLVQPASGSMDTRPFDTVYVSGHNLDDAGPPSIYATPSSELSHPPLPPLVPIAPSGLSSTSPDSPTPTAANASPTARVFRSKSMHQPSTPPPVPPPLRRKRPESAQIMRASGSVPAGSGMLFQELVSKFEGTMSTDGGSGETESEGAKSLSRHLSLSGSGPSGGMKTARGGVDGRGGANVIRRSSLSHFGTSAPAVGHDSWYGHGRGGSVSEEPLSLAGLQRTFASLQPKLDKARYKAEAGISRRGFIQGGGEDVDSGGEREGLVRHARRDDWGSAMGVERDELKWPVNRIEEGWAPL